MRVGRKRPEYASGNTVDGAAWLAVRVGRVSATARSGLTEAQNWSIKACMNGLSSCFTRVQLLCCALALLGCSRLPAQRSSLSGTTDELPTRAGQRTALDDYVAAPDTNYTFHLIDRVAGRGETTFILEMTSQAWLTTNEVDRPIWKHWLNIVKPDVVDSTKSLLLISGGRNGGKPPKGADPETIQIALATKSVVTELKMIPNQPLVFAGETEGRVEDSLIAYTWDKYLRTGDPKWPARLPMTKAAVRAMDTITSFCGSAEGGSIRMDGFVVAGGSKRGWTTWTTAAVDKRVVAIVPVVIDMLNIEPSMQHHFGAYGFWSPAIGDY
jgi:PhoPQ-activated pathogenicity-related protein